MTDEMKLAILEKMGEQLQGVIETIEQNHADLLNAGTDNLRIELTADAIRQGKAQLEALEWAHSCCALAMEAGVSDALTTH